jgi:hypothetical protein
MSGTEEPEVEPTAEDKKEAQLLKEEAEKEKLKEEEEYKKLTDIERKKYFKGTIVVIVIYGIFILGMSIMGIVSPMMRELLFVSGFPFTVTFISGVILIIILLLVQLYTYKPAAMPEKHSGDNMSCPDYWILKKIKKEELDKIKDSKVRKLSKYYCENPEDSTAVDVDIDSINSSSPRELRKLKEVVKQYNEYESSIDTNYHMKCNRLYPDYMASVDKRTFPLNPTSMRCAYIQQCNSISGNPQIAWTNVCNK